jgi:large subunit ribosomal protein L18
MKNLKRRRKENKTDYGMRIKILKGEKPRLIFRKSNKYLITQYVKSNEAQDKIVFGMTSRSLIKYGWPENMKGSLKSIPAAYLMGLICGKKIKSEKLEKPILDLGMTRNVNKNRFFSFIKGLIDSGLDIKCNKETLPEEDRIKGKNLKEDFSANFSKIKTKIEGK